jgi:molybdopterin-guanine dinucleotide biosynthesis adapter protein
VHRAANCKPLVSPADSAIVGIASDVDLTTILTVAHVDDTPAIASMILSSAISIEDVLGLA